MKTRSQQLELMDLGSTHYTPEEYQDCLKKLFTVGKLTGINKESLSLIKKIAPKSVVDVGCGGGLFLQMLATAYPKVAFTGIDCAKEAIDFAKQHTEPNLTFTCTEEIPKADLIITTLVCHHLSDSELPAFLHKCYQAANKVFIINDLQRSRVSKILYQLISGWLFHNRLICHDGAISIARGFTKQELTQFFSPYPDVVIRWKFPFRWQVIVCKRL